MKFLITLIVGAFASEICPDLEKNNQELRESIQSLRGQLQVLSGSPEKILEDFIENKEKLNALVEEFMQGGVHLNLAEEIQHYLKLISEDLKLLDYSPEDISEESVENTLNGLKAAISKARSVQANKEFSKVYNQLMMKLDESEANVSDLQVDNAGLLGHLESARAELVTVQNLLETEKNLRILAEAELSKVKIEHSNRIEVIEQAMSQEEHQSRQKEIENFRKIQESQNLLISQLQAQNSEQALRIEQLGTDKSALENSWSIEKSTVENLQSELQARDEQLISSEMFFENFRRKVEIENNEQIENLKASQESLQGELKVLQAEKEKALESYNNCTQQLSEVVVEDRLKENIIKGLSKDIENAGESVESAKFSRSQEVELLEQAISDLKSTLQTLQSQYDEALEKILTQNNKIRELEEKISDLEYVSQRNLRG